MVSFCKVCGIFTVYVMDPLGIWLCTMYIDSLAIVCTLYGVHELTRYIAVYTVYTVKFLFTFLLTST